MHYTVKKGDTLYSIADKYYGKGFLWRLVRQFNKDVKDPNNIQVGQRIYVPFR